MLFNNLQKKRKKSHIRKHLRSKKKKCSEQDVYRCNWILTRSLLDLKGSGKIADVLTNSEITK